MLTKRQNMLEVVRGGTPDRFVKQYEALAFVMNTPYFMKYPLMPEGPGAPAVQCAWGYWNAWPAGQPGAFPLHDAEHLVCPDISEWRKYVKAPDIDFTEEDWKPAMEAAAQIDRNEYFVTCFVAPGLFEMVHYLCEIQEALMAYYEDPDAVKDLIAYVTEWELRWAEQICRYLKPDALFHHDDWGTQNSTFLGSEMFREFFLEPYKKIYQYYQTWRRRSASDLRDHSCQRSKARGSDLFPGHLQHYRRIPCGHLCRQQHDDPLWKPDPVRKHRYRVLESTLLLFWPSALSPGRRSFHPKED